MSDQSTRDPRVTLIARTVATTDAWRVLDPKYDDTVASDADYLGELAGRQCYESWSRPNPDTPATADAHASFTFRLVGVSRSLTHELIRHRFLAVSEVSQRYVNMSESRTVTPPALREMPITSEVVRGHHDLAVYTYDAVVEDLVKNGATRKQAREAARCVLPGGTETKMIVSGNVRAWRDFIVQRNAPGVDAEIREIAAAILTHLHQWAPNSVADLTGGTQ